MDMTNLMVSAEEEAELKAADLEEPELPLETPKEEPKADIVKETPKEEPKPEVKTEVKEVLTKEQEIVRNLNAALRETREEMKGLKSKLSTVDELKKALLERKAEDERRNAPVAPDPNEDPFGYQQHMLKQIEAQQRQFNEQITQTKTDTQTQNFIMHVQQQENNFRLKTPDYDKAIEFISEIRKQELADFGITDPDAIARELQQSAFGISSAAIQQGKNPAEVIYGFAKRYGYKPEVAAPAPAAQERLETVSQAQQKAGKTLSGAGETEANATIDALLKAKGTEFDKLWGEMFDK